LLEIFQNLLELTITFGRFVFPQGEDAPRRKRKGRRNAKVWGGARVLSGKGQAGSQHSFWLLGQNGNSRGANAP